MKRIIMIIAFISWAVSTVHAGDIVVEHPSFGVSNHFDSIEIEKIVLNDTATVLYCKGFNQPGYRISITRCYLQANGKKYPVQHAVDIEFNKEACANQQGEIAFSMIFPPIDTNTQYFGLIEEDNPQDKGRIWDIAFQAKKAKSYGKLPEEFRKAAHPKDDGTALTPPAWLEANAVLKGRIAGYRPEMKYDLNIYFPSIITESLENHSANVNDDGSFEISVPMLVATQVWLKFGYKVFNGNRVRTNGKVLLTPGDTAQLYVDLPACFKSVSRLRKDWKQQKCLYFSSTNADINNQIFDISNPKYLEKYTEVLKDTSFLKMDIQEYKNHILQIKKACAAELSDSKIFTSKAKDFFRIDLDYLTASVLLIKALSTMPDVAYYDFLRDLPLNNPLSLYSSEYANTCTCCRFIKTGENETRQKEDILQEMIQTDHKGGLFFDLMRCRRICALPLMKPEEVEEETGRIQTPFLIQYLEKEKKLNVTANFLAGLLDTTATEWNLNKKLPEEKGKIDLYGFKTVFLPENDRQAFRDMPAGKIEEMKKQNTIFADDFSSYRFYFPLSEAIIEYEGTTYTADENGRVEIPGADAGKISIIGRAPSDKVKGSKFEKPLKPENDSSVMSRQSTLIFDCGEFNGMD